MQYADRVRSICRTYFGEPLYCGKNETVEEFTARVTIGYGTPATAVVDSKIKK